MAQDIYGTFLFVFLYTSVWFWSVLVCLFILFLVNDDYTGWIDSKLSMMMPKTKSVPVTCMCVCVCVKCKCEKNRYSCKPATHTQTRNAFQPEPEKNQILYRIFSCVFYTWSTWRNSRNFFFNSFPLLLIVKYTILFILIHIECNVIMMMKSEKWMKWARKKMLVFLRQLDNIMNLSFFLANVCSVYNKRIRKLSI